MFTTSEEEFIELKLKIKDTLEKVKNNLNHINILLEDITNFETILEIKEELLGIQFHLAIQNDLMARKEDIVIHIILDNIIQRIKIMYLKGLKEVE